MKTFAFKRITEAFICTTLCLSVVSCHNEAIFPVTESDTGTEALTTVSDIITDSMPVLDSLPIHAEYCYTNPPEISGQTSNPNIFTTDNAETPFLYFGENGFMPCEVEITEYPVSLTIGDVTVSNIYKEYSFEGEIFYPSTTISGSLTPGGAYAKDAAFLWTFHKQDSLIYCHLSYYGICDIVVYDTDSHQWSRMVKEETPTSELYQSILITGDSLYYLALHDSMSPDRNYMLYVVSDGLDTVEFDYYLYHFTSKTSTPICDQGFDSEIILGGLAATNSIWLDNHIVRIFPYSDEIGFSDHFISNDGTISTKTYTYNEYNDISLLKNDTIYFGRYRIMQNNEQGTFTVEHIDKDHTSLNAFSFEQNEFNYLFSEKFRMLYTSDTSDLIALSPCGNYMLLHGDDGVIICDLPKGICSKIDLSQYAETTYLVNDLYIVYNMYLTADGFIIILPDGVQTKKVIYFKYK